MATKKTASAMSTTAEGDSEGVVGEDVQITTEPIPFDTVYEDNPNLPEGTENVKVDGVDGERTITTTTPTLDGEPSGDPVVTTEVTTEPVDQVIERGTGVVGEDVQTATEPIPYETEYEDTPSMVKGEEKVKVKGVDGERTITTTTPTLNGEPSGDPVVTKEVTKEPVTEIIERGTADESVHPLVWVTVEAKVSGLVCNGYLLRKGMTGTLPESVANLTKTQQEKLYGQHFFTKK